MHLCQSQLVYFCQLRQKLPGGIRFGQFITVPPSSALSREKSAPLREKKMPAADATRATAMRDSFKWDFARGLSFFSLSWSCNYFLFLNLHVTLHSSCYLCIFLFSLHAAFHSSLCPLSAWEEEATSFVQVSTLVSQPLAPVRCLPFISFLSL